VAKVIHVITRLDRGGSAENTLLTCLGLAGKYELVLAHGMARESRMTAWEKQSVDARVLEAEKRGIRVAVQPGLIRAIAPLQDLRAAAALWRLFKKEKPDIVHTHTSKAGLLGRWAARLARVPLIVHTPHGHVFYGHFGPFASRIFHFLEKMTSGITDRLIPLTQAERADYLRFSIARAEKMVTIHSGVEISRYAVPAVEARAKKEALGLPPDRPIIGTVGWLLRVKGSQHLFQAMTVVWKKHPAAVLVYAGKGDLEGVLRGEACRLGVSDRVVFLGWRDDIPDLMHLLDIFVLPSLNEGMGRVLVEAMAAGKPIVASRVGGIIDLVKDGCNGILSEPGDVEGLSRALMTLLNDPGLGAVMGACGKAMAEAFGVAAMVEKIDALYTSLLQGG